MRLGAPMPARRALLPPTSVPAEVGGTDARQPCTPAPNLGCSVDCGGPGGWRYHRHLHVGVAELADALASGASVRKDVGVQVPPTTPATWLRVLRDLPVSVDPVVAERTRGVEGRDGDERV